MLQCRLTPHSTETDCSASQGRGSAQVENEGISLRSGLITPYLLSLICKSSSEIWAFHLIVVAIWREGVLYSHPSSPSSPMVDPPTWSMRRLFACNHRPDINKHPQPNRAAFLTHFGGIYSSAVSNALEASPYDTDWIDNQFHRSVEIGQMRNECQLTIRVRFQKLPVKNVRKYESVNPPFNRCELWAVTRFALLTNM